MCVCVGCKYVVYMGRPELVLQLNVDVQVVISLLVEVPD